MNRIDELLLGWPASVEEVFHQVFIATGADIGDHRHLAVRQRARRKLSAVFLFLSIMRHLLTRSGPGGQSGLDAPFQNRVAFMVRNIRFSTTRLMIVAPDVFAQPALQALRTKVNCRAVRVVASSAPISQISLQVRPVRWSTVPVLPFVGQSCRTPKPRFRPLTSLPPVRSIAGYCPERCQSGPRCPRAFAFWPFAFLRSFH